MRLVPSNDCGSTRAIGLVLGERLEVVVVVVAVLSAGFPNNELV